MGLHCILIFFFLSQKQLAMLNLSYCDTHTAQCLQCTQEEQRDFILWGMFMSNLPLISFCKGKYIFGGKKDLAPTHYAFNMKFKVLDIYVYTKNVSLIITKHVLYVICFPDDKLNYLFYFNVSFEGGYGPLLVNVIGFLFKRMP